MKRETISKIMAIIALIWISIGIVWTWVLVLFWGEWNTSQNNITKDNIQKMIDEWKIKISDSSWNTQTWAININSETWVVQSNSWILNEKSWSWEVK